MSVSIVAAYPWNAIRDLAAPDPPGVIISCDTKLGSSDRRLAAQFGAKFRRVGRNIFVTYTSSNFVATSRALDEVANRGDARQIGEKLKKYQSEIWRCDRIIGGSLGNRRRIAAIGDYAPGLLTATVYWDRRNRRSWCPKPFPRELRRATARLIWCYLANG
jgi:hypothetical protein